jgi:hypothetical protein
MCSIDGSINSDCFGDRTVYMPASADNYYGIGLDMWANAELFANPFYPEGNLVIILIIKLPHQVCTLLQIFPTRSKLAISELMMKQAILSNCLALLAVMALSTRYIAQQHHPLLNPALWRCLA